MKFYVSQDEVSWLTEARAEVIEKGTDKELYFHIGYFNTWYSAAEIWLTLLLAKATGVTNLRSFDLLTKGMDARVKVQRLRDASETFKPIGPNLAARLLVYEKHLIPLRNFIAHTYAVLERESDVISFNTLSVIPSPGQKTSAGKKITTLELFEMGAWLLLFNNDLKAASRALAHSEMIEIDKPESPLLPAPHPLPDSPPRAATPKRRDRKRIRKGLKPRGSSITRR